MPTHNGSSANLLYSGKFRVMVFSVSLHSDETPITSILYSLPKLNSTEINFLKLWKFKY